MTATGSDVLATVKRLRREFRQAVDRDRTNGGSAFFTHGKVAALDELLAAVTAPDEPAAPAVPSAAVDPASFTYPMLGDHLERNFTVSVPLVVGVGGRIEDAAHLKRALAENYVAHPLITGERTGIDETADDLVILFADKVRASGLPPAPGDTVVHVFVFGQKFEAVAFLNGYALTNDPGPDATPVIQDGRWCVRIDAADMLGFEGSEPGDDGVFRHGNEFLNLEDPRRPA